MTELRSYHKDAIRLLRAHSVAHVPRAICHGAALRYLETLGLVQKAGIPGLWVITDDGHAVDIDSEVVSRGGNSFPAEPSGYQRRQLMDAYSAIDKLRPGSVIFRGRVRQSCLDELAGRSRAQKFVYFAYPIGFPLKHIAWAVSNDKPNWTEQNVSIVRGQVLGLPAMRGRRLPAQVSAAEKSARQALLAEGYSDWEIEEYFAIHKAEAVL